MTTEQRLENLANRLAAKAYACPDNYVGNMRSSVLLEVATTILQELSGNTPEQVAETERRAAENVKARASAPPTV